MLVRNEMASMTSLTVCSLCGGKAVDSWGGISSTGPLMRCGRCGMAAYCCKDHQTMQWPLHKKTCRQLTASAAAVAGKK